ncbi:MAG TPA: bifunctional 4-hydroxy-2-oxoglutarate aldolase/2-dehydro-3-deoxy-phosphogluconate aldolase [Polyangiaceae bacterium]|nr:bifunctional 4-hydroxy-2-oxoglutarate aldolase/2-dehydro-3-deoxy-phosphogluconate aldolase [Polyangiaceae bacterium]
MSRREHVGEAIRDSGVVAIVRTQDASRVALAAQALARGGVTVLEITMSVPGAVDLIASLSRTLPEDVLLGAGTVLDVATAERVLDAGATFVVSPIFSPDLIVACQRRDAAVLPGCFSPTEIFGAHAAGADLIKVFPATALGPKYVRDLLAPLPDLRLVPTGGVSLENAREWLAAGAVALGIGSGLLGPALLAEGNYDAISERAGRLIAAVKQARGR